MKFDNRADPYPFFDELRKTPVARVADDTYVVTGYRELMALAHDPRISSDISRSPLLARAGGQRAEPAAEAEHLQAYGRDQSIICLDPPEHDRARRQVMRHFGPPHSPDLIPSMEPDIQRLCNELLDKQPRARPGIDVVDEYAYPVPVAVICKILGVPLEDEPTFHAWIFDCIGGLRRGPGGSHRGGARPARRRAARASARSRNTWPS